MRKEIKDSTDASTGLTRRTFISGVAGAAALTLMPGERLYAGSGKNTIPVPPNFPAGIPLYQQTYTNWAQEISVADVWTCSPATPADVVTLANWGYTNGFRLRPLGSAHGFAPTILQRGSTGANFLLVNTMDSLTALTINTGGSPASVTAQAGVTVQQICEACEPYGLGFLHTPAPGDVTIAGSLAMNVHGAAFPSSNVALQPGHSYGTFSNLVLSLTAVIWNASTGSFALKTFQRSDSAIGPLLTHVSRAFVTEATLQMGPNLKLRCHSRVDIDMPTLFANPAVAGSNSFGALVNQYGSTELLWYPFVQTTGWVKTWEVAPTKPSTSREVTTPYNYPETVPLDQADQIAAYLRTYPSTVPQFNQQSAAATQQMMTPVAGDEDTQVYDLWGSAYCSTLYVQPETLRLTTAAWGVVLNHSNIQRAIYEFYLYLTNTLTALGGAGMYPYVGPVDIRGHGIESSSDVLISNAVQPYLSGARPLPDHSSYDVILWFAVNNNVDQPGAASFNTNLESWFLLNYSTYGIVRPEWTKTYAYTATGAYGGGWTNTTLLTKTYPGTFHNHGYSSNSNWNAALSTLDSYDPHRIFTNPFLDTLMP